MPFTCNVKREPGALHKVEDKIPEGPVSGKHLRWLHATPDGSKIVFSELGKLWVATPGGTPKRLTNATEREYEPTISPDGQWVARVTWSDKDHGYLWKARLDGAQAMKLDTSPAFYSLPEWSNDSSKIAFVMGAASGWLDEDASNIYELKIIAAAGGAPVYVSHVWSPNSHVTWSSDNTRLFYDELDAGAPSGDIPPATRLVSIQTDGIDKKMHVKFTAVFSALPSPDRN